MEAPTHVDISTKPPSNTVLRIWDDALFHLHFTGNEILLPINIIEVIEIVGIEHLKSQLSSYLSCPCVAIIDNHLGCVRILARPEYQGMGNFAGHIIVPEISMEEAITTEDLEEKNAEKNDKKPENKAKVPRPPNAFILYRKYYHAILKDQNPNMHNNVISVTVGRKWNSETDQVKSYFKAMADQAKREHAAKYPDYQYAPRKPSEKKRRNTRRTSRPEQCDSDTPSGEEGASPLTSENYNLLSVSDNEVISDPNVEDLLPFAEIPTAPAESYEFTDFEMGEYNHWVDVAANAQEAVIIANHNHITGNGNLQTILPMMHAT